MLGILGGCVKGELSSFSASVSLALPASIGYNLSKWWHGVIVCIWYSPQVFTFHVPEFHPVFGRENEKIDITCVSLYGERHDVGL